VPLFYQGQGESGGALAEMRRERSRSSHTAVAVRARARALAAQLVATERALDFYGATLLPLRERILEEAQLQYNAMQIGVFQLLAAKRDALLAERSRLGLLGEYWVVRNELERLLAGRLGPEVESGSVSGPSTSPGGGPGGH
jgi:cobalt-zinc-cadmium efflux system outer membrane protein